MKSLFLLAFFALGTIHPAAAEPPVTAAELTQMEASMASLKAFISEYQEAVKTASVQAPRTAEEQKLDRSRLKEMNIKLAVLETEYEKQQSLAQESIAAAQAAQQQAQLLAAQRAEVEYQTRLAAWKQQQAAALAASAPSTSPYTSASAYQRSLDAQAGIYAPQAQSQAPFRPYPQAVGTPGFDLLNTVDFHFSPGGAWLHGSNGQTFHVTHPAPGVTRLQP